MFEARCVSRSDRIGQLVGIGERRGAGVALLDRQRLLAGVQLGRHHNPAVVVGQALGMAVEERAEAEDVGPQDEPTRGLAVRRTGEFCGGTGGEGDAHERRLDRGQE